MAPPHVRLYLLLVAGACAGAPPRCGKTGEAAPAPPEASDVLRKQIKASLGLNGDVSTVDFDAAFRTADWAGFAAAVNTQDFSVDFLRDGAGSEYAHFDYGLGDNDFGSVHPKDKVDAIIKVNDGDWMPLPGTSQELVQCLEEAEDATAAVAAGAPDPLAQWGTWCSSLCTKEKGFSGCELRSCVIPWVGNGTCCTAYAAEVAGGESHECSELQGLLPLGCDVREVDRSRQSFGEQITCQFDFKLDVVAQGTHVHPCQQWREQVVIV